VDRKLAIISHNSSTVHTGTELVQVLKLQLVVVPS